MYDGKCLKSRPRLRILLIDADVRSSRRGQPFPNLALLKLGTHYLLEGDEVRYLARPRPADIPDITFEPDVVFVSSVFRFNGKRAQKIRDTYRKLGKPVMTGGLAFGRPYQKLPRDIEHIRPDYDFFKLDYSLGFSSRGCIRRCPFCYVWRMEGKIRENAPIAEFLDERHKKLILLDGNFVASPDFRQKTEFLIDGRIHTNLNQGIDLRIVDEEIAGLLKDLRSTDERREGSSARTGATSRRRNHRELDLRLRPRGIRYIARAKPLPLREAPRVRSRAFRDVIRERRKSRRTGLLPVRQSTLLPVLLLG